MNEGLPSDPVMLMSAVNMLLRDSYPEGLDALCRDRGIDKEELVSKLSASGFDYLPEINQFR